MDQKKFRFRYLMGLTMHPLVLLPAIAGLTVSGLMVVLQKPLSWLGIVAGSLVSVGFLFSRAILSGDKIAEQALKEVAAEENAAWANQLDALDAQLSQDQDPRDEELLRALRELLLAIQDDHSWRQKFDSVTAGKLRAALNDSFEVSLNQLRDALDCKKKAEKSGHGRIRALLLEDREKLLAQVTECVNEFETVFRDLRGIEQGHSDPNHCITRLKQTLEIGKRVRDSMKSRGLSLDQ
jgi:hypothetical protein